MRPGSRRRPSTPRRIVSAWAGIGVSSSRSPASCGRAAGDGASPLAYRELLVNDLADAAISLRPGIGGALAALRDAGAEAALVTGSGPTAFGIFEDIAAADAGAARLGPRFAGAIVAGPDPER